MKSTHIFGQLILHVRLAALVALLLFAFAPGFAAAAETRGGNEVVVEPGETINDDLYVGGGTVTVLGRINGDLIVFGGNVTVTGPVRGDVIAAGGTTVVQGPVGRNVRAAGGQITVASTVAQDVVVAGGTFTLGPEARVGRDLLAGTGTAIVDGAIGRNVIAYSGDTTLNGAVVGNVRFDGSTLRLGPSATIGGNLTYTADSVVTMQEGTPSSVVRGQVLRAPRATANEPTAAQRATSSLFGWMQAVVGLFVLGLALVLAFPTFSRQSVITLRRSALPSFGIGLAVILVVPIAALLLFGLGLIVGGWWLGPMALAIYIVALMVGLAIAALSVGTWLSDQARASGLHPVWALLLGTAVIMLADLVPIFGAVAIFLALTTGLGSLAITGYRIHEASPARTAGASIGSCGNS